MLSPSMAYHNSCTTVSNDFKSNYGLETRTVSGNAKPAIQTFIVSCSGESSWAGTKKERGIGQAWEQK